eukprot:PITA_17977
MSREKDFAWAYCDKILGDPKLLCKFCKAKCSGGIYRFKYHLAQILGHDICLCKNVDENVKYKATLAIDMLSQHNTKKEKKKKEIGTPKVENFSSTTPLSSPFVGSSMQFPSFPHIPPTPSPSQTQRQMNPPAFNIGGGNINTFFPPRTKSGSQPTLDTTGPYWQAMIDVVVVASPGFKAPSLESIRTNFLLESLEDAMLVLSEFCSSWVETGCAIMSDGWTDKRNRTLINLLVSCLVGTMFLKLVDASDKVKIAQLICEMMEEVI